MDALLYGHNDEKHVVAVHHLNDSEVRLYIREEENSLRHRDVRFFPFFFLSDPSYLQDYGRHHWLKELAGSNHFRFIAAFSRWSDMWDALRSIIARYNRTQPKRVQTYADLEILLLKPDPLQQFFLQSGITLFKGMSFDNVHRMQIDIKTNQSSTTESTRPLAGEAITVLTLVDNRRWQHTFDATKDSEELLLRSFVAAVQERDPDVIEGHRLFGFQLPLLMRRAERLGIDLALGRDGSSLRSFGNAETQSGFDGGSFDIPGRHLVDTLHLTQVYNQTRRIFEIPSPIAMAEQLGFRFEKQPPRSASLQRQRHIQSQLDAAATRFIAEQLLPSSFYLTQICPMSLGSVVRAGSAAKIELLMLREYIRQKHSIPRPQPALQTGGGYTELFLSGIVGPVVHADVESLYPSIIVSRSIAPETDELRLFPKLLESLLSLRLRAKKEMHEAPDLTGRVRADALQSSLKVLINSFYGYLGHNRALFNDYAQADVVTTTGQELLREIIRHVELHNGTPIQVDTDGIFFLPPDNVVGEQHERSFVERISGSLPPAITLLHVGRFKKMLSYRKKNYALLSFDNELMIKGSSFISRSLEPFCRQYIRECIHHLLNEDLEALHQTYVKAAKRIINHQWHVVEFARTEVMRDSLERYEAELTAGTRNQSAAYEVAKRAGRYFTAGERISYYVTGSQAGIRIAENAKLADEWDPNFPDENTPYYLGRLEECSRKFEIFFTPEDFQHIFSLDDLFGFRPQNVKILTRVQLPKEKLEAEEEREFGIWLEEE